MNTEFLLRAKNAAYASGIAAAPREDGGKELFYSEGEWSYHDLYYGYNPFVGEEVLMKDSKVIWSMNYVGRVTDPQANAGEVYTFLQHAMQRIQPERPYRGPAQYAEGDYTYEDVSVGTPQFFSGRERILFRGQEVYELLYHGGSTL